MNSVLNSIALLSMPANPGTFMSLPASLLGGIISAFNPCCLPMIPAVVVLTSQDHQRSTGQGVFIASMFVLGFATAMAIMGALTTSIGLVFGHYGEVFNYIVALIPLLMALQLLGVIQIKIPWLHPLTYRGYHGAFLTGALFTLVIAPCATPILASILAYAAASKNTLWGTTMLFVYGLGAGVPLIMMGSFMSFAGTMQFFNRHRSTINALCAAGLIGISLYLLWVA